MVRNLTLVLMLFAFCAVSAPEICAQTTEFTYQGSLSNSGTPATGSYDFEFVLFDSLSAGAQLGSTLTRTTVSVAAGTFSVKLDFGAQFPGANRFLEIRVRTAGAGVFTTLTPRQLIGSAPQAVQSLNAANATTAGNVTGVVAIANGGTGSATQNFVDLTNNQTINGNKLFSGTVSGNGSGLTGLSATNLTTGSVPDARLSSNVDLLNAAQTLSGAKTFSATTVFNGNVGIGTNTPERNLHVFSGSAGTVTADVSAPLVVEGSGNTFINVLSPDGAEKGILFGGPVSQFDGSIRYNNSGNLGGLQFRTNGNTNRMVITNTGNVGIGTTAPGSPLDVQVAAGQSLQFRQDSGLVPGINVNTTGGNAGTMRLRNSLEIWPSNDSTRAGRLDIRNTAGSPSITLDGQTGNLAANNLPGVEFDVPANPFDLGTLFTIFTGQTATIKTIVVDVPANGFLVFTGSVYAISQPGTSAGASGRLDIFDESASTTIATSFFSGALSTQSIQAAMPVSAGTRTFSLKLKADDNSGDQARYFSNPGRLIVMFFPVRY